jgi:hypothetical protein
MPPSKKKRSSANLVNSDEWKDHEFEKAKADGKYEEYVKLTECVIHEKGRVHSYEENKLFIHGIKLVWYMVVQFAYNRIIDWSQITETFILNETARYFRVGYRQVKFVYDHICEGVVAVQETVKRGAGSPRYVSKRKLNPDQLAQLLNHINEVHFNGATNSISQLQKFFKNELKVDMSTRTIINYMRWLGLSWKKANPRKRTLGAYRLEVIRDYLQKYDLYFKKIRDGDPYVFVYMDESYFHNTHSTGYSWLGEDASINKGVSRGRRLVIIHAITKDGPLCQLLHISGRDGMAIISKRKS